MVKIELTPNCATCEAAGVGYCLFSFSCPNRPPEILTVSEGLKRLNKQQIDLVCKGELCPVCLNKDAILCVGNAPDGMHMNNFFDCTCCGAKWEGY